MAKTISRGGKAGVILTVNFQNLLEDIQKAQGNVEQATWDAARAGGREMYKALEQEATASGVPAHLVDKLAMQAERDAGGNRVACRVGWRMSGNYDPRNPADEYKVIFMNYGTPHRLAKDGIRVNIGGQWKTLTTDRGRVDGRGFIGRAKKKARPKVKKAQEAALKQILEDLQK